MIKQTISYFTTILFFRHNWVLWTLILTIVFLGLNIFILTGSFVGIWDADGQFVAYYMLVADHARAGKFALWDVWTNAGLPIGGDPQIGVFSPINFLTGLLTGGSTVGFRFYWLFIWWLGGLGVMLLGRHLKAPAYGCFVVALGYLFCGVYITNAEHISWLVGFSFLPFIIWRLDAALCSQRFAPAVQAGALWGLSALSCYPAYLILTIFYAGFWAVGRLFFQESEGVMSKDANAASEKVRLSFRFVLVVITITGITGLFVLSPTYFSFIYENAGTGTRTAALSREVAVTSNPLHPGALSTFTSPYIAVQKIFNPDLWSGMDISMSSIYAGAIILVFAVFALANRPRDWWRWWLFLLALSALAFALGGVLPFRSWLYDLVYPTRFFRHPAVFRAYYLFFAAVLALFGMRDWHRLLTHHLNGSRCSFKVISHVLAATAIFIFFITINFLGTLGGKLYLAYLHVFIVWLGIALFPHLAARLRPRQRIIILPGLLVALAMFDALCVYRLSLSVIATNSPPLVQRWQNLDRDHSDTLDLNANGFRREEASCYDARTACVEVFELNNDQMINKMPVFHAFSPQENVFQLLMARNSVLKRSATGTNRIWFSAQAVEIAPNLESYGVFSERAATLGSAPLVVHTPKQMLGTNLMESALNDAENQSEEINNLTAMTLVEIDLINYQPESLAFECEVSADGWLLITDRWARGWTATVNDRETPVYGGNFIFRAIRVAAGRNSIRFSYQPRHFPYLLILSWGTLAVVFIILPLSRLNWEKVFRRDN